MAEEKETEKKKKTKRPTAKKRDIQSEKKRLHNRSFRSRVQTEVRAFEALIAQGQMDGAKEKLDKVYSLMDKGVKTNIVKLNRASRVKSRLNSKLVKAPVASK